MFNLNSLVVVQMSFCLIELCSKPLSLEIARIAFGSLLADSRFWRCKVTTVFGLIPNFFSLFLSKAMDKEPLYGQIGEIGLIPVHKRVSTGQNLSQRGTVPAVAESQNPPDGRYTPWRECWRLEAQSEKSTLMLFRHESASCPLSAFPTFRIYIVGSSETSFL